MLELKAQADGGNAAAQFKHAMCLATGQRVAVDENEAARYYKLAAD
jgi:TPR repeat protein